MSDSPAAISGSLVNMRNVGTHKSVALTVHVPEERAQQVIAAFGWPTMTAPVPIAIARLEERAIEPGRREALPHTVRDAGIVCREPEFWVFISHYTTFPHASEAEAAAFVRKYCMVESRREIMPGSEAEKRWNALLLDYGRWRNRKAREAG